METSQLNVTNITSNTVINLSAISRDEALSLNLQPGTLVYINNESFLVWDGVEFV